MNSKQRDRTAPGARGVNRRDLLRTLVIGSAGLGIASCTPDEAAMMGQMVDLAARYGGGYMPSQARTALSMVRQLSSIAQYQATQQQIASVRSKANSSSSAGRQFVRVKPSSGSSSKGTHVVSYNPKTQQVGSKVLVVPETDLKRGDSVSINGQSGKII